MDVDRSTIWLERARDLLFDGENQDQDSKAVQYLRTYFAEYAGRFFEPLYDRETPDRFTSADLLAVTALSVVVPPAIAYRLTTGWEDAESLLKKIGSEKNIEDLSPSEFDEKLGEGSPAWNLWELLNGQPGIGSTIAGKLLAAKRPGLIPISDSYVKVTLGTDERHLWRCMWTILTDGEIQNAVAKIRNEVDEARELSLLRVVDIVAWRYGRHLQIGI
jgi:hypothetical protein